MGGAAAVALATSERILVTVHNRDGQAARDRDELRQALQRSPREIPSRFFYDDRGSRLFERITTLPEYYQTRTEHALLRAIAGRVAEAAQAAQLVEIGSGSATKTRVLLDAMARTGCLRLYVPVDFARGAVRQVAEELAWSTRTWPCTVSSPTSTRTSRRSPRWRRLTAIPWRLPRPSRGARRAPASGAGGPRRATAAW